MAAPILFVLLFVLSFGVLLYFLRPTPAETAVEQHLAGIAENRVVGDGTTILREEGFSSTPWLHDLVRQLPGSLAVAHLIKQAGKKWQVSSLLLFSLLATIIGWWLASLIISIVALSPCIGVALGMSPYLYLYILREAR